MTFEEKLKELLEQHGMPEKQAHAVMDRVKTSSEEMSERWEHQVEDYPLQVLATLWLHTKMEALTYVDEACPKAWFRPMFERSK